jgi:hypothetical protein
MTAGRAACIAATALALLLAAADATAQTVVPVLVNGDPANRLDIAFLGDGYTADEMSKFAADVDTAVLWMLGTEPFRAYRRYLNIRRIEVASAESGASHPGEHITRNTAFGAFYDCGGLDRLICLDTGKVATAVQAVSASERDLVVVLVNDQEYGGSGGAVIVAAAMGQCGDLVLHELGHTFGYLADEYGGPPPPTCEDSVEPGYVNATKETNRDRIKWRAWIDPSTPIPTNGSTNGVPGLFAGARYCDTTLYRPVYASKMRALWEPYWQINAEQLVKRIYAFVDPIDSVSPPVTASGVSVAEGESRTFSVSITSPLTHLLTVAWYLDGQPVSSGAEYTLPAQGVTRGAHTLQVVVADPTTAVRTDELGVLKGQATWTVKVGDASKDFSMTADRSALTVTRGQSGTVTLSIAPVAARFESGVSFACGGLPAGASCTFAPASLPVGTTTAIVMLAIATTRSAGSVPVAAAPVMPTAGLFVFSILLLTAAARCTRRLALVSLPALAVAAALAAAACGKGSSGGGSNGGTSQGQAGTPAGTYPVTVAATSGAVSHAVTITVTVQ